MNKISVFAIFRPGQGSLKQFPTPPLGHHLQKQKA